MLEEGTGNDDAADDDDDDADDADAAPGVRTDASPAGLETIQGVDYVNADRPQAYADAWVVPDCTLCRKESKPKSRCT